MKGTFGNFLSIFAKFVSMHLSKSLSQPTKNKAAVTKINARISILSNRLALSILVPAVQLGQLVLYFLYSIRDAGCKWVYRANIR